VARGYWVLEIEIEVIFSGEMWEFVIEDFGSEGLSEKPRKRKGGESEEEASFPWDE
jgi:hypothetical protein